MIIIEGLDATGKSTLAHRIHVLTGAPIQPSQGPEKYPGEIIKRIEHYFTLPDNTIYDRHPLISQFIYGQLSNKTLPPPYLLQELKRRNPYVIEALPQNLGTHQLKEHDTPEHLAIVAQRDKLQHLYEGFLSFHFPLRHSYTFDTMEEAAQAAASYINRQQEENKHDNC